MRDPIADLKHELMAAAERQLQQHAAVGAGRRRLHVSLSRNRVLLTTATVAIAAAATLLFTTPWNRTAGLGFLEQVQAALTPRPGWILHKKLETPNSTSCLEIWIDQTPPHRYRVLLTGFPWDRRGTAPRAHPCVGGTPSEFGNINGGPAAKTLRFVPPNTLSASANPTFSFPVDNVRELREAISAGRAHDEGTMQFHGRTVERIRIDPPSDCPDPRPGQSPCSREPSYWYVNPETFYPVQVECEDCPLRRVTFLTYELLPRTDENLALTDILEQHPDAAMSGGTPVLRVPAAKTVRAAKGAKSARVTFKVTATDGGDIPVSCWPRSGSRFPLGETMVECVAFGSNGRTDTEGFTVTVKRRR
jgi:HYR domain